MKVSVQTIKNFIDVELPDIDTLVQRINERLGGVEQVINLAEKYKDTVIVRVVTCEKHPDADRLHVTLIDDGGRVPDVPRNQDGFVQVVCGAPNVTVGMFAVWLPPKSTVPASYDDVDPFVLDARPLRGILSQGMLAAADELDLGKDHAGLLEIMPNEYTPSGLAVSAGASFADVYCLNDTIIDIENKMFTHRPDLFGQLGVAREIAAIVDTAETQPFRNPKWYQTEPNMQTSAISPELRVYNNAENVVPRYTVGVMDIDSVVQSPVWLRCAVTALGARPINAIVDATNYVMFLTAQPTHAYDYDKLHGGMIGARMAKSGEQLRLLNGKTYALTEDDIVIADEQQPVGLAGIMGGSESEVDSTTKRIVLEAASFDMYVVRKTAMRHGVFTDALTRFNKGQSPLQTVRVLAHLMSILKDVAGAKQRSEIIDTPRDRWQGIDSLCEPIVVSNEFINRRLGLALSAEDSANILRKVNIGVETDDEILTLNIPFWRTDIELPEDVVEEIGRLYGFDRLPRQLPIRTIKPAPQNAMRELKNKIRQAMKQIGANEVLTYSFVHENIASRAGQHSDQAFKLSNALSPDLQFYRLSVLPSLLDKVHMNIRAGHDEFVLYEIGKAHHKDAYLNSQEGELPREIQMLDAVYASRTNKEGAAYYYVEQYMQQLMDSLGIAIRLRKMSNIDENPAYAPFDIERSAAIETQGGTVIGLLGELRGDVVTAFKLPEYSAALTLDLACVLDAYARQVPRYRPLSRYPSVHQDLTVTVPEAQALGEIEMVLKEEIVHDDLTVHVAPKTIYRAPESADKAITFHIEISRFDRTMKEQEVTKIVSSVEQAIDSYVRS